MGTKYHFQPYGVLKWWINGFFQAHYTDPTWVKLVLNWLFIYGCSYQWLPEILGLGVRQVGV